MSVLKLEQEDTTRSSCFVGESRVFIHAVAGSSSSSAFPAAHGTHSGARAPAPPTRMGQHFAMGMATERSAATRLTRRRPANAATVAGRARVGVLVRPAGRTVGAWPRGAGWVSMLAIGMPTERSATTRLKESLSWRRVGRHACYWKSVRNAVQPLGAKELTARGPGGGLSSRRAGLALSLVPGQHQCGRAPGRARPAKAHPGGGQCEAIADCCSTIRVGSVRCYCRWLLHPGREQEDYNRTCSSPPRPPPRPRPRSCRSRPPV